MSGLLFWRLVAFWAILGTAGVGTCYLEVALVVQLSLKKARENVCDEVEF